MYSIILNNKIETKHVNALTKNTASTETIDSDWVGESYVILYVCTRFGGVFILYSMSGEGKCLRHLCSVFGKGMTLLPRNLLCTLIFFLHGGIWIS